MFYLIKCSFSHHYCTYYLCTGLYKQRPQCTSFHLGYHRCRTTSNASQCNLYNSHSYSFLLYLPEHSSSLSTEEASRHTFGSPLNNDGVALKPTAEVFVSYQNTVTRGVGVV